MNYIDQLKTMDILKLGEEMNAYYKYNEGQIVDESKFMNHNLLEKMKNILNNHNVDEQTIFEC